MVKCFDFSIGKIHYKKPTSHVICRMKGQIEKRYTYLESICQDRFNNF